MNGDQSEMKVSGLVGRTDGRLIDSGVPSRLLVIKLARPLG
ncbi:hypothetical protein OG589_22900 [Sphaerisporangium sp. NBC_01403]